MLENIVRFCGDANPFGRACLFSILSRARVTFASLVVLFCACFGITPATATPYTMTVPATGVQLPAEYPQAGGVALVFTGVNGNIYYQFSNPDGAFVGYQNTGSPAAFRGNPFTINSPITLDCGFRSCTEYFGGAIARVDIRFSAYDGDTQAGGFDQNDITLRLNGFDVGNWSGRTTDSTNDAGTVSFGLGTGFGNNTFDTGWFSSTNAALLANILQTNRTVTQVFDRDPNDNYWDFRRGTSLPREDLRTIAPGYEFEKEVVGGITTYSQVGDVIDYLYTVRNIGSVDIDNITVVDDRIPNVTCPAPPNNSLARTSSGAGQPQELTCTGSYRITQADIDAGAVTNIARANGTPEFGELGTVSDTATVTGPAANNAITLTKSGAPNPFGAVGSTVAYTLTATNTGNTTLRNVVISDPRIAGQTCSFATLLPLTADNATNTASCTLNYTVRQTDVDAFAINGTQLANTATVRATTPAGTQVTATGQSSLPGQPAVVTLTLDKTALQANYDAVGDVIDFRFAVTNTGNVTWPAAPTISDPQAGTPTCPAGAVAPGRTIICTRAYTVTQADLDAGAVVNTATASITVAGATGQATDTVTTPAVVTTGLVLDKRLRAGSPNPFTAVGQVLAYDFVLRNTGTTTLTAPAVADTTVGVAATPVPVTCPPGPLAPGGQVTCTSDDYVVTQADLDAGSVTNTATASATAAAGAGGGTVTSNSDSVTVTGQRDPALTLVKTPPTLTALQFSAEPLVTYTYDVTNTGNVTIPGPIAVTDDRTSPSTFTCQAGPLAVGQTVQCTATYQVTNADSAAGFVRNDAFATGSDGTVSPTDSAVIPQEGTFDLLLEKEAVTADFDAVGDTVDFTLTFTNTGDLSIFASTDTSARDRFVLTDPGVSFVGPCEPPATLFPVGSGNTPTDFSCTVQRIVTQQDIDAGEYTNTASLTLIYREGQPDEETQVVPPASATVPAAVTPGFTIAKASDGPFQTLGDTVSYTFTITNTSAQTLSSVALNDPLVPAITCAGSATSNVTGPVPPASQAPNNVVTCTGSYQVTQADLDAGQIDNTVTATATTPTGATLTDTADATTAIDPAFATRTLSLVKSVVVTETGDATFTAPGQTATYTFAVQNTGNLTLNNVTVTDADLGFSCAIPTIAPTATDQSCTVTRTTTQADFDAGSYVNTASASAAGVTPDADDTSDATITATGPARVASFVFDKTAPATFSAVGDTVDFVLSLSNTGGVTLTGLTITDTFFDPDLVCSIADLAPGATDTTCRGSYQITQADIDAGQIENAATFAGTGLDGAPINGADTVIVTGPAEAPALAVTKVDDAPAGSFTNLPETKTYTFTVRNTGNVTLTNLTISDPLTGFSCALSDLAPGAQALTCADNSPLSDTYTVTQADIDRGEIENTVTVTGETTRGTPASQSATLAIEGPDQLPALDMVKSVTSGAPFGAVGDTITYSYVVTNTGNTTLTSPVTVADDRTTVTCPALPVGGLSPGATLTCTATDSVTQADLDAGEVTNTATARVTQRVQASATYPDGLAAVTSAPDTATVQADQQPALTIAKRIRPGTAATFDGPGDLSDPANPNNLVFEFIVRNAGNVTTTGPITVLDPLIQAAPLTCTTAPLAPGAQVICALPYAPTQADVDAGRFDNTATAETLFDGNTVATAVPGSASALAIRRPSLTIAKSLVSLDAFSPGEVATYRYDLTNDGNTTITGPITVNDDKISGPISCGAASLAPGDTTSCTATYTIVVRDLEFGSVTNTASGTNGTVTSDPTSLTIPPGADPTLSITKTPQSASFSAAGEVIDYVFVVTNTSSGTAPPAFVAPVVIIDDKITTPISCPVVDGANPLDPGDSITCTGTYTVTQADVDALRPGATSGFVINNAFARSSFAGEDVSSPVVQARVDAVAAPALTVSKTAENQTDPGQPAAAGDVILFTIVSRNTGTQTLQGVTVDDPFVGTLTCDVAAPVTLAPPDSANPGEALTCTGTYTVTQADVDAGDAIANTATAEASTLQGAPVSGSDSATYAVSAPTPAMTVTKTLIPTDGLTDFSTVGETLSFRVAVANTGNITLNDIAITDSLVPGTCDIANLAPGATNTSCVFDLVVTQADIDRGTIDNTATATAQPANPGAAPLTETGTESLTGPDRQPQISLGKTGSGPLTAGDGSPTYNLAGQTLTYVYTVANTGNVTLNSLPVISDDRIANVTCDPLPAGGLLPSQTLDCRGTDVVDQDDVNAGSVTNNATATAANDYGGAPLTATASETIAATATPDVSISKVPSVTTNATAGTEVTYTYTVQNPGNVTLTDITLVDFHTSAAGVQQLPISGGGIIPVLQPGDEAVLTATYTVTQADIDSGNAVRNTVSLTSSLTGGGAGPTDTARARVDLEQAAPSIALVKTADTSGLSNPAAVGDVIGYAFTVTNTGNVTLTDVTLSDPLANVSGGPIARLAPGGVDAATFTASYTLTQADIDAGQVVNAATATGGYTDATGSPQTTSDASGSANGNDDPTVTPLAQVAALALDKVLVSGGPTFGAVGETLSFRFDVRNTGNVTLTDPVTVNDPLISGAGGSVTCPAGPLAPGALVSCTGSYAVTQADIDAGGVTNTATAASGATASAPDAVTVPSRRTPALETVKTAVSITTGGQTFMTIEPQYFQTGAVVAYDYVVTNTGNTTITAPITVTDNLIPVSCPAVPGGLAPQAAITCTATYTVNGSDVALGSVTNVARASDGTTTSPLVSETVPQGGTPALALDKALVAVANGDGSPQGDLLFDAVGDVLTYQFTVTNTGNAAYARDVVVDDARLSGPLVCFDSQGSTVNLAPAEQAICTGTYVVTQADLDAGSILNEAVATTIFGPDGDTTIVSSIPAQVRSPAGVTPSIALVKTADTSGLSNPAAVGDVIGYAFTVTNTGNVTLTDVTLSDPLANVSGGPIARLAPGGVDAATFTASYTLTQADIDAGQVVNAATATGGYTDATGSPQTTSDASGSANGNDDPTVTPLAQVAALDVTKVVTQTGVAVGDVVIFEITARNSGTVTLRDLTIDDAFTRIDGSEIADAVPVLVGGGAASDPLSPGDARVWTLDHILTQEDLDAGGLRNSATVGALDPSDAPVSDLSDNANDADGNTVDDATVLPLIAGPAIELEKRLTTSGAVAGDRIVFTIVATNLGNVSLSDLALTDTFTRADGSAITDAVPVPNDAATVDDPLAPGLSRVWTLTHVLTQSDIDAGGLSNTATITASDPTGAPVTDVSDNGIDDDGNTVDDPTRLPIDIAPGIEVTKTVATPGTVVGDTVVYQIAVRNTGNVTLTQIAVTDTMSAMDGTPRGARDVVFVQGTDATTLGVGETNLYEVRYVLTQADFDAGGLMNVAEATAVLTGGGTLADASDNGDDGDGNIVDDPTVVVLESDSKVEVTKTVGIPRRLAADRVAYPFTITVENTGNVTQTGVQVTDDLAAFAAPGRVVSVRGLQASGFAGLGGVAGDFDGIRQTGTLQGDVSLAPGQTGTVRLTVVVDPSRGYPAQDNVAAVTSDRIDKAVTGAVTVPALAPANVRVTKLADSETALLGGTVGYTLTFENLNNVFETGLTVVDALPDGLTYTPGTARYDGAETPQPVVDGRRLEWRDITLAPRQTVTVTLQARVTGGDGDLTNTAYVLDPGQNVISNRAEATVSRRPEAVFDCGDVIGKVFDDRNLNGYQDGAPVEDRSAITDQTYAEDKFLSEIDRTPTGEPGLAGVRLATVNGTIITTDGFGRFSVPCAELPADIGSNFTLKLDTRTLPTGYSVTTENPRTVRLTPGTVTKLNFGAALANVVDIDLTAAAFAAGTTDPVPALPAGIDALLAQIRDVPATIRLGYYTQGEGQALARARLDAVEALIRSRWRRDAPYRLKIDRTIQALQ